MNKKPKIDVVTVELGINIEEEIKKETDQLSKNIESQIQGAVSRSHAREVLSRDTKASRAKQHRKKLSEPVFNLLVERSSDSSLFTARSEITELINIETSNFGSFLSRFRSFLKNEHGRKWALIKSPANGEPAYRLQSTIH